jgi:hypothetical protein
MSAARPGAAPMAVQVVRPAGAGHETLWVLLAAVVVLLAAAWVVGLRAQPQAAAALAAHQLDARTQLNAAEQGVHADLLVAAEEILALHEADQAVPGLARLREMALPPFVDGPDARARGAHEWRAVQQAQAFALVGQSAAPGVAASFLLRLPLESPGDAKAHAHSGDAVGIWVQREGAPHWPQQIDDAALVRQGWRQVITRYDAGVTRKDARH